MLTDLSVSKFAIVDRLTLSWMSGFTVITGETGAGKSIIVDAIGALVGGRVYPDMVQAGASRATIEGVFHLGDESSALTARLEIEALLNEAGISLEEDTLIVTREIVSGSGRGVSRINGRAVPLSLLQRVGEWLIDIHGQSEHLSLLRAREQLDLLDRYARLLPARQGMASAVRELRRLRSDRLVLEEEARSARREESLLRHEIAEIEAANLDPDEETSLQAIRLRLRSAERLQASLGAAAALLSGQDEQMGAVDLMNQVALHVRDAARYDSDIEVEAEALESAAIQTVEVQFALTSYLERLAEDSGELESVEERVLLIADLKRKYGTSVPGIIDYLEQAQARLTRLERHDVLIQELIEQEGAVRKQAEEFAAELSRTRQVAAVGLSDAIQSELNDLGLRGTKIEVRFTRSAADDGLDLQVEGITERYAFDETGAEHVELLIAPNPGEPPRPLARIASGGELARVSLAIKTVLSQVDTRATLIFDEVDVGVGGRSAGVVGEKLWDLTAHHQVLCITHMPQVAAFADQHVRVQKSSSSDATQVIVDPIQGDERAMELAAMLGGIDAGSATLASARELISRADDFKAQIRQPERLLGNTR